ncbi:MAG: hypothetical protein ACD_56C00110G0012 [uncultured bacterium]|nr:MAG: hypothetical protein ACD_56C00110G0012 [uncultured bacterium]
MIHKSKDIIFLIKQFYHKHPYISDVGVFFFFFGLYFSILHGTGVVYRDDHFFYFKYSELLRTLGWERVVKGFDWNYYSQYVFGNNFDIRPSFFHLMLMPFTFFEDKLFALKMSDIFFASISFTLIYNALKKIKIKNAFLCTVFLFSVNLISLKFLSGRPLVLSVGFLALEFAYASNKEYKKFAILSLLHVLVHQSSFFWPVAVSIIVEVGRYLSSYKFNIRGTIYSAFCTILVLFYFPGLLNGLLRVQKSISKDNALGQGVELYKRDVFDLYQLDNSLFLLFIFSITISVFIYLNKKNKNISEGEDVPRNNVFASFLLCLFVLCGIIFINGRFLDYFGLVLLLFIVVTLNYVVQRKLLILEDKFKSAIVFGLWTVAIFLVVNSYITIRQSALITDVEPIRKTSEWIMERSGEGELVFLIDWSLFSPSFFFNHKNVYTMAMDPQDIKSVRPDLYWKWYNIFNNNFYCDEQIDCSDLKKNIDSQKESMNEEQKKNIDLDNAKKIVNSIKNDFKSNLIISNSKIFSDTLLMDTDDLRDSVKFRSDVNSMELSAFQLR